MPKTKKKEKITKTIARSQDKTIQINFTIPSKLIKTEEEKILSRLGEDIEVPGFRKGMAPITKVKENVKPDKIVGEIINNLLLPVLRETLKEEDIKPIIYPKLELISAKENEDWQIRVTTCEMPEVDLTDYKEKIRKELKPTEIWTPDKKGEEKEETREKKEQRIIEALIKSIKVEIPLLLIEEEVNHRLSQLLERIEKLGLSLEKYLESISKTPESLRKEYQDQARQALALELILSKIAQDEKLEVSEKELEEVIKMSSSIDKDKNEGEKENQREIIKNILLKRKALEFLTSLL